MTNEEKARELAFAYCFNGVCLDEKTAYDILIQMSAWKEEQMLEKAMEWFRTKLPHMLLEHNPISTDGIFEDFKQAMMEE